MPNTLDNFRAEFFRALAHPMRIRILRLLRSGEKSVSELQAELGVESSNVSQQLAVLRHRNLVKARRESAKVLYTVKDPKIFDVLNDAREIFDRHLVDSRAVLSKLEEEEKRLNHTRNSRTSGFHDEEDNKISD